MSLPMGPLHYPLGPLGHLPTTVNTTLGARTQQTAYPSVLNS